MQISAGYILPYWKELSTQQLLSLFKLFLKIQGGQAVFILI
jgi:hypothetical protein